MSVLADTSALYALLDRASEDHDAARTIFPQLLEGELLTHNYVVLELLAVAGRRLGPESVRRALAELLPALGVVWVDQATHDAAVAALVAALPTRTSLVDFVSFHVMRERAIAEAFAFDADFTSAGFQTIP